MARQNDIKEDVISLIGEASAEKKKSKGRLFFWIAAGCVFLLLIGFIFYPVSATTSSSEPRGEITQPEDGSKISLTIVISGYTENIPPDRPYVIIAVDVENKNLSWPKKPVIKPNVRFLTHFKKVSGW